MIKPYYEANGITLYNCRSEDILDEISDIDLVITDPPYGMNYQSNCMITKKKRVYGDEEFPVETINKLIEVAKNAAFICCRWNNIYSLPEPKSVIVWNKVTGRGMGDLDHEYGRCWEAILFYKKQNHEFIFRPQDVINLPRTNNKFHPTEKPVALMSKLIAANIGSVVLDPFAGSGSTLIAARENKRKAIGIEFDEQHCETIVKRLKQETLF